jgi:hypothetical protein
MPSFHNILLPPLIPCHRFSYPALPSPQISRRRLEELQALQRGLTAGRAMTLDQAFLALGIDGSSEGPKRAAPGAAAATPHSSGSRSQSRPAADGGGGEGEEDEGEGEEDGDGEEGREVGLPGCVAGGLVPVRVVKLIAVGKIAGASLASLRLGWRDVAGSIQEVKVGVPASWSFLGYRVEG